MSLDALRQLEELSNSCDILSVSSLRQNVPYRVLSVRSLDTVHGAKTVVKLDDDTEVFLPSRFGKATPELIQNLNSTPFCIIYKGEEKLRSGFKRYVVHFTSA